ncbi:response regulator [Paenibacillus sp. HWE-109]|uniref:response regulator transcription factor n=1 Tax=Paenibacillus sp. HWE-109 TaxID=1306526 RepID=UPI001EDF788A|nr:response regulator [Paenibacillus sp. HWE-109]UKS29486.1 response regulator [Paenibacillus sp. HWE-109]
MAMKVIIVDDEPYVRQMIKSMINWNQLSLELVGEFFNGEDDYNWIKQDSSIDLVISDLRMPVMDGLNLIKEALAFRPELKFVVISAYDDYHLVKEAFKLGALDHLLKSEMTEDHLYNALSNLRIIDTKNPITRLEQIPGAYSLESQTFSNRELIKESLLSRLVAGNIHTNDIDALKELLCENKKKRLVLMILKMNKSDIHASVPEASVIHGISKYLSYKEEMLDYSSEVHYEIVQISPYEFLILLLFAQQESDSSILTYLTYFYDQFCPLGFKINLGLSHISSHFDKLPQLIHEARISNDYCFVAGNGSIIRYQAQFDQTPPYEIDSMKQITILKKLLNSLLFDSCKVDISEVMVAPRSVSVSHMHEIKDLYMKYHFILVDFSLQNGLDGEIRALSNEYIKHLKLYDDLDSLNKWLASIMTKIKANKGENSIISHVKHFVEENYTNDISLQSVANKFNINSSYLSRLFSEKVNTNFIDYLAHIRITKAIELIKTSNLKMYEVTEKVGYTSPEHFSRTFKKITGKSPKQFMDGRE